MMFFWDFWASHGRIWVKIGGNQAEAFPDLPIQPRNLDFDRITGKIAKEIEAELAPPPAGRQDTPFREISRTFPGNVREISGKIPGKILIISL